MTEKESLKGADVPGFKSTCKSRGGHHNRYLNMSLGVGSREAAYTYSISSAAIAYSITQACSRGNISSCGCEPHSNLGLRSTGWKWGGCSADVRFGVRLARKFVDAREIDGDARSLMNLHNNKAGRKAVKKMLVMECKCHGVSGSCTMKTCWKSLPPFSRIGDHLMAKYKRAKPVISARLSRRGRRSAYLMLKRRRKRRTQRRLQRRPRGSDLVFLDKSPNYCEANLNRGSLGTIGRICNRTSHGVDGCEVLCCGRGYNTYQYMRKWQCKCKFYWCCDVHCSKCSALTEEYTCK